MILKVFFGTTASILLTGLMLIGLTIEHLAEWTRDKIEDWSED